MIATRVEALGFREMTQRDSVILVTGRPGEGCSMENYKLRKR
jgi:hypothetical protein